MATPEVAVSIAAALAHFHFSMLKHFTMLDHLPSCMSPVAQIWDRLRDWARIGSELYNPEELKQYNLTTIRQEVITLTQVQIHGYTWESAIMISHMHLHLLQASTIPECASYGGEVAEAEGTCTIAQ